MVDGQPAGWDFDVLAPGSEHWPIRSRIRLAVAVAAWLELGSVKTQDSGGLSG